MGRYRATPINKRFKLEKNKTKQNKTIIKKNTTLKIIATNKPSRIFQHTIKTLQRCLQKHHESRPTEKQ